MASYSALHSDFANLLHVLPGRRFHHPPMKAENKQNKYLSKIYVLFTHRLVISFSKEEDARDPTAINFITCISGPC
jgi:hypothetical protein